MSNAVVDHVINNRVSPPTDTPIGASAENVTYSEETTYSSGSVGSAISGLKENLSELGLSVVNGAINVTYTV